MEVCSVASTRMATLIPSFSSCAQKMTSGERRFARRLEGKLEDDYLLWYDVPIGPKKLHPDFIVLHPSRGLFILEVKDWKLDYIQRVTHGEVDLLTPDGLKTLKNPLQQARGYALEIKQLLEKDGKLVRSAGRYQGSLLCPYAYGVVLSNITREAFESVPALGQVLDAHVVICQDEFLESVDAGMFQERLWGMSHYDFGSTLSCEQIDRIRWHFFPELRISAQQLSLFEDDVSDRVPVGCQVPDILQIMDLQQEQLARSLGDGHRVIHGVAGSGKTLILAYRAQYLAESIDKPILALCFNVSLASRLKGIIEARGLGQQVVVRHFHGWCRDLLQRYRIGHPDRARYQGVAYTEQLVQSVIAAVEQQQIPSGLYGAVMIDEGHDFQPTWFKLVTQMVDSQTNSLLVLYDDAQNLYSKRQKRQFSFKRVGIQAQGRTTILRVNYRNPMEVLSLAYAFAKEVMEPSGEAASDLPILVQPETAGRRGAIPELIHLPSFAQETVYLAKRIQQLHDRGMPWNDMAIVYRSKFMGERIAAQFQRSGIPIEWINRDSKSRYYQPDAKSVKLLTMHSSKGLEFPVVCIPGLGYLPHQKGEPKDEARLFYVAMTRAMERLILTSHRASEYVQRLEAGLQAITNYYSGN